MGAILRASTFAVVVAVVVVAIVVVAVVVVAVVVVRTRPRAIPLPMITMRKSIHGFLFPYMVMGLRLASGRRSSATYEIRIKSNKPSFVLSMVERTDRVARELDGEGGGRDREK